MSTHPAKRKSTKPIPADERIILACVECVSALAAARAAFAADPDPSSRFAAAVAAIRISEVQDQLQGACLKRADTMPAIKSKARLAVALLADVPQRSPNQVEALFLRHFAEDVARVAGGIADGEWREEQRAKRKAA